MRNGKMIKRTLAALLALCLTVTTLPAALFASAVDAEASPDDWTENWVGNVDNNDPNSGHYVEKSYANAKHWTGPQGWTNSLTPIEDQNESADERIDPYQILTVPAVFADYGQVPADSDKQHEGMADWNEDLIEFDEAIQKYHVDNVQGAAQGNLAGAKFKFPLYFGTFGDVGNIVDLLGKGTNKNTENNSYAANPSTRAIYRVLNQNPAFISAGTNTGSGAPGGTVIMGMVGNTLDESGRLMSRDGTIMPYFDFREAGKDGSAENGFLAEQAVNKNAAIYKNATFPFTKDEVNKRYVFDSASGHHNIQVTKDENDKTATTFNSSLDAAIPNWSDSEVTSDYGFFPFNSANDPKSSRNYAFGMRLDIPFTLDDPSNSYFYFSGDDDVWVYVDGVLMLDLGGVREQTGGYINFGNEKTVTDKKGNEVTIPAQSAYYTGATLWPKDANGDTMAADAAGYRQLDMFYHDAAAMYDDTWTTSPGAGADAEIPGKVALYDQSNYENGLNPSIKTLLQNAGYTDADLTAMVNSLTPGESTKAHTLTVFYMERGLYDSNLHIEFTFDPVNLAQRNGLTIANQVDYQAVNKGLRTTVSSLLNEKMRMDYVLERAASGVELLGQDGQFTLTPNTSENFDREDTSLGGYSPQGKPYTLTQNITGVSPDYFASRYTINPTVASGDKYTRASYENNSAVADSDDGNTFTYPGTGSDKNISQVITFVNQLKTTDVQIRKQLTEDAEAPNVAFGFKVVFTKLAGIPCTEGVPFEGEYTVDGQTYTAVDGEIAIPARATATLSGIPVGSEFIVTETDAKGLVFDSAVCTGENVESSVFGDEVTVTLGTAPQNVAVTVTNKKAEVVEYYGQVDKWVYLPMEGVGEETVSLPDPTECSAVSVTMAGRKALKMTQGQILKYKDNAIGQALGLDDNTIADLDITLTYYREDANPNTWWHFNTYDKDGNSAPPKVNDGKEYDFGYGTLDNYGMVAGQWSEVSVHRDAQHISFDNSDYGDFYILLNNTGYTEPSEGSEGSEGEKLYIGGIVYRATLSDGTTRVGVWGDPLNNPTGKVVQAGVTAGGQYKPATVAEAKAIGGDCKVGGLLYKANKTGDDRFNVIFSDGSIKPVLVHNYQAHDQLYVLDYGLPVGLTNDARGTDAANYTGNGTDATVTLVYATGDSEVSTLMTIGNGDPKSIKLPTTGSWDRYGQVSFTIDLSEAKTITFAHEMFAFNTREVRITTQAGETTYKAAEAKLGGAARLYGTYIGDMHADGASFSFDLAANPNGARLTSKDDTLTFYNVKAGSPRDSAYNGVYAASGYTAAASGEYGALTIGEPFANSKYTPDSIMNDVDAFTYGVQVTTNGQTAKDATNATPVMEGSIKFVPASNVYYEDNFAGENAIRYFNVTNGSESDGSKSQGNDNDTRYGYDDAYTTGYNGNTPVSNKGALAFTFTGTGADIMATASNQDVTVFAYVYDATTVTLGEDGQISKKDDNTQVKLEAVKIVNVKFNGSNTMPTNVPVIALRGLEQDHAHLVKLMVSSRTADDARFLFQGVRVYNPIKDTSNYKPGESDATLREVRSMILGDGKIELSFDSAGNVTYTYVGAGDGATADLFMVRAGEQTITFGGGETRMENISGDAASDDVTAAASSLLTYLQMGPNNEVYLSGGNGVAFMASAEAGATASTLQVSVKSCFNKSGDALYYLSADKTWKTLADSNAYSNTEMYFDIPVANCAKVGEQYLIALRVGNGTASDAGTILSLVNLKVKGYTLSRMANGTALSTLSLSTMTPEDVTETIWKSLADGRTLVTFQTSSNIADVRITKDGKEIEGQILYASTQNDRKVWSILLPATTDEAGYNSDNCVIQQAVSGSTDI